MSRRYTLREIRAVILEEIVGEEWISSNEVRIAIGLGGHEHYRVGLVLERLVLGGELEIRNPRSRGKRYFRRAA